MRIAQISADVVRPRETPSAGRPIGDVTEVLPTELVSNVIRHVGEPLTLRAVRQPSSIRVEVDDPRANPPMSRDASPLDDHGHGLLLIGLADEWGVTQHHDDGKTVWFEIDVTTATDEVHHGYSPSATSAAHWSGSSYQGKWPPGMVTKRAPGILSTLGFPAAGARNRSSSGHTKSSGTAKLRSSPSVSTFSGRGVRPTRSRCCSDRNDAAWPGSRSESRCKSTMSSETCRAAWAPAASRRLQRPEDRGTGSRAIQVAIRPRTGAVSMPMMRLPREPWIATAGWPTITAPDTREDWSSANHSENSPPSELPTSVTWSMPSPSSTPAMTFTACSRTGAPCQRYGGDKP